MKNLFTAQFWFNPQPDQLIPTMQYTVLVIIVIFLILAIISQVLSKKKWFYKPLFKKLFSFFVVNAIVAVLLDFFSEEMIPFFSIRFWFILWGIGMVVWIALIIAYVKKFSAKKEQFARENEYKKYLP
jgi:amino acid transporter